MHIAFISYEYPPDIAKGGIGTYVYQQSNLLVEAGCSITVFAGSHLRNEVSIEGEVKVVRVRCTDPQDFRDKVVVPFQKEHTAIPFDIVESPEIHANALRIKELYPDLLLIVRLHAPNYLVEHLKRADAPLKQKLRFVLGALRRGSWDLGYWRKYDFTNDIDYQITLAADCITAPSDAMRQWAVSHWKINKKKIHVIPNAFYRAQRLLQLSNKKLSKRVVFLGRLNPLKGLVNITFAMKYFLQKNPDWQWRIIGDDGPSHIHGLSMKTWMDMELKKVLGQVEFIDGVEHDNIPDVLQECDFAVQTSLFESFSYVCLELLAAGVPVIGSKRGGMSDIITDGKSGFLVDPKSKRQIFKGIKWLAGNLGSLEKMKAEAKKRAMEFDNATIASQYLNLVNKVLSA